ncbi:MAG: type II secretion system F family protein [Minisyncoccia bacterium]
MKFNYKARTKEGELQVGTVEANSKDGAINILVGHNLFVLSIEPVKEADIFTRISDYFQRIKTKDLMVFTRQFATLISAQISINDSLLNLFKQTTNPVLKEVIREMSTDVESGFSLSQALERHPGVFSEFYINMVRSAEATGKLEEVLNFMADYLENQEAIISKVKNALIYPAFVIGLFFVVIILMTTLVLPQIIPVLVESNVQLPLLTEVFLFFGQLLIKWWWLFIIIVATIVFVLLDYFKSKEGKIVLDEVILRLPVLGILFQKLYISRFAESTRVLVEGGLTVPQSVEIASHTIGNIVYRDSLSEVANKIRKGDLFSKAIMSVPYFPPLVGQLIAIGESTGRLGDLLKKINEFYTRDVNDIVSNLVELIQPALMVVIGIFVALLFASILLPLYSLTQAV